MDTAPEAALAVPIPDFVRLWGFIHQKVIAYHYATIQYGSTGSTQFIGWEVNGCNIKIIYTKIVVRSRSGRQDVTFGSHMATFDDVLSR